MPCKPLGKLGQPVIGPDLWGCQADKMLRVVSCHCVVEPIPGQAGYIIDMRRWRIQEALQLSLPGFSLHWLWSVGNHQHQYWYHWVTDINININLSMITMIDNKILREKIPHIIYSCFHIVWLYTVIYNNIWTLNIRWWCYFLLDR